MQVRDGQVITNLANNSSEPEEMLAVQSDLQNWAYWCFIRGFGLKNGGTVHFHNHSGFESTYRLINLGLQQAMATPMPLNALENEDS